MAVSAIFSGDFISFSGNTKVSLNKETKAAAGNINFGSCIESEN
jgi:hypothetical protein